ncbi:MAG: oxygen-insensitive NADPH nitroreductase [Pseudomonadota bacterium]
MNPTIDLLQAHRSIRRFTDKPISGELLEHILLAGQAAATSSFIQATSVVRVLDNTARTELVELTGGQKYVASAAEFLVLCADLQRNNQQVAAQGEDANFGWTEQFITATVDVALFAQNMVIAAQSAGLGICYIGGIRNNPDRVSDMLGLPELVYPVFGLCLGYPDQDPEKKPRLPLSVIVHENQYQASAATGEAMQEYNTVVKDYYQRRSSGKLDFSWSEQMLKQSRSQSRPFMQEFLQKRGFLRQ